MKIFLIGGKARHGKDTSADLIQKYLEAKGLRVCRSQISRYLKYYIKDHFAWNGSDETKPRDLLQELGTDIIRQKLNKPRFFIDRTIEDIEILSNFFDCILITDIRYPDEFDLIKEKYPDDTIKIIIRRINFEESLNPKQQQHLTETALDNYEDYDYLIINDSLEKLDEDIKKILEKENL